MEPSLLSSYERAPQDFSRVGTWDCSRGTAGERASSRIEGGIFVIFLELQQEAGVPLEF